MYMLWFWQHVILSELVFNLYLLEYATPIGSVFWAGVEDFILTNVGAGVILI
jgi:hypothetical protein